LKNQNPSTTRVPRRTSLPAFIYLKRCVETLYPIPDAGSFKFCINTKFQNIFWANGVHCIPLKDIRTFEEINAISISIFGVKRNEVIPLSISQNYKATDVGRHISLLYINKRKVREDDGTNGRYYIISDLGRLLGSQIAPKLVKKIRICPACLRPYRSNRGWQEHYKKCGTNSSVQPVPVIDLSRPYSSLAVESENFTPKGNVNQGICGVCFSAPRNVLYMPCNHIIACEKCALISYSYTGGCIICRELIGRMIRVYLA